MATKEQRKQLQHILSALLPLVPDARKSECREIINAAYRHFRECSPAQTLVRSLTTYEKAALDEHPRIKERLREFDSELKRLRHRLAAEQSGRVIDRQKAETVINWQHILGFAIGQLVQLLSVTASNQAGELIQATLIEEGPNVAAVSFSSGGKVAFDIHTKTLTNTCELLQGVDAFVKRILVMIGTYRGFGEKLCGSPILIGDDAADSAFQRCVMQALVLR